MHPSGTCERPSALYFTFLSHAVPRYSADWDKHEPLLAEQWQPRLEGRDRRIMRMTDGNRATVLPRKLLDPYQLLGDRRLCLVVVEKHVTGGVRHSVGNR